MASKISGVGIHTIRAWEKRYKAVVPKRNPNGRREFSETDLERLVLLSELCTLGHSIGQIANYSTEDLKELLEKLGKLNPSVHPQTINSLDRKMVDTKDSLQSLMLALRVYKLDVISHEIEKLKLLLNPREMAIEILDPLLYEVGRALANKSLSLSQEHALSSILKFHVGHSLYRLNEGKSKRSKTVVLATPEGEYNEFLILQSALLCSHYGHKFYYLGTNLPAQSLIDAMSSVGADTLVLGSTYRVSGLPQKFQSRYVQNILSNTDENNQIFLLGESMVDKEVIGKYPNFVHVPGILNLDQLLKETK